ncbi:MAG: phosphate ABC transporter substrate-binding protein PstS, partial [Candidatus Dormibacteraceae bacterium]
MRVSPAIRASFVAAIVGALLLVAACGSPGTGSSNNNSGSSQKKATSVKTGNPPTPVTLQEAGSSLLFPYLQQLTSPLTQKYSNITLSPAAGGSGTGQAEAISGTIDMGGSDAYLSPAQFQQDAGLMNVPIAISSQAVNFNLKGVSSLNLTGNVLAQIYEGKITNWNSSAISSLNPGVTLPNETIVPIRRVDSSGDTFIFTSFLSATNSAWSNGPSLGTTVAWPAVSGELSFSGNPAMVQGLMATPGSIAYVGISVEQTALQAGLGEGALQNKSGKYVKPDATTVLAAVAAGAKSIPANLAASLIYEPGAQSYPIVNYEYLIIQSK